MEWNSGQELLTPGILSEESPARARTSPNCSAPTPLQGYICSETFHRSAVALDGKTPQTMPQQTVNIPLFYDVIVINTIKVHRINHMHARADTTTIKTEVSRSI
jgi:hypothetical protein